MVTIFWKLILLDPVNKPEEVPELYHLEEDPHERDNKAEDHPEIVDRLTERIQTWWSD